VGDELYSRRFREVISEEGTKFIPVSRAVVDKSQGWGSLSASKALVVSAGLAGRRGEVWGRSI